MPSNAPPKRFFLENLNRFCALMRLASRFYHANPLNEHVRLEVTSADVLKVLSSLNAHHVQYLIVDGLACVFYGYIRTSVDLTLWVRSTSKNKENLLASLDHFTENGLKLNLLEDLYGFKQADFDQCYTRAIIGSLDNVPFNLIALGDLIQDKQASKRRQDLTDAEALSRITPSY